MSGKTCESNEQFGSVDELFTLNYKDDQGKILDNWWCERTENGGAITKYFLKTPDNHFEFLTLGDFLTPQA